MDDWLFFDVEDNFMYIMRCDLVWMIVEVYILIIKVNYLC